MYWMIGRNFPLSTHNKLLIYRQILRPVCGYDCHLWGCAKTSNIDIIHRCQNKVQTNIVDAPRYIRNTDLLWDPDIDTLDKIIKNVAESHGHRFHSYINLEVIQLFNNTKLTRRLKRTKPFQLVK